MAISNSRGPAVLAALVELPLGDGRSLLGFHGSPASFDDIIVLATPDEQVRQLLGPHLPHILAGGHTHIHQLRQIGPSFYFGCGSVGRAYRHDQAATLWLRYDPWAEYAPLTVEGWRDWPGAAPCTVTRQWRRPTRWRRSSAGRTSSSAPPG